MKKGFTLIELLVVVLIIGILSSVALPQYTKAVEKSRMTQGIAIGNALQKAVDVYLMETGFPSAFKSLIPASESGLILDFAGTARSSSICVRLGPSCLVVGNFMYAGYCYPNECTLEIAKFREGSGGNDTMEYRLTYKNSGNGWTKTYTQTSDAKANLKADFQALGFSVN